MSERITVKKVRIENIRGIVGPLEFTPGQVTIISGKNGRGKSSVIAALEAIFSGGSVAELITKGAKEGMVDAEFSNGVNVKMIVRPTKTTRTVEHPETGRVSKPETYIQKLTDLVTADPFAFVKAPKKDRRAVLQRCMPMTLTQEQLEKALGAPVLPAEVEGHALAIIEQRRDACVDNLKSITAGRDQLAKSIAERKAALPVTDGELIDATIAGLEKEIQQLDESRLTKERAIDATAGETERQAEGAFQDKVVSIQAKRDDQIRELEAQIKALRDGAAAELTQVRDIKDNAIRAAQEQAKNERTALDAEVTPKRAQFADEVAQARTRKEITDKAKGMRDSIIADQAQVESLERDIKACIDMADRLEKLAAEISKDLPIPGVQLRDGDIYVNGVEFDGLNKGQQMCLGLEIAALDKRPLGLVFMDEGESLDTANFNTVQERAKALGLGLVITKVTDDEELQVATV
jgi:DNA repair exonuclease SbcCD ATPase subunit